MERPATDPPLLVDDAVESWRREQRQVHRRLSPAEIDNLVDAYQGGTPCAELAERFGIDESTVFAHLKRRKVERRPYRKLHGAQLELARERYESGRSLRAVASELGVSRGAVHAGLVAIGVKMRSPGRSAGASRKA